MSRVKSFLIYLLVSATLLGAAFGGGFYMQFQKRRQIEKLSEEAKKKTELAEEQATKLLMASRARTQLIEAALAIEFQNFGMAMDRLIRTQSLSHRLTINVDREIDEINGLLMQQKSEAIPKILTLADRLEPAPSVTLPANPPPAKPAAAAGAANAAALGKGAAAAPGDHDFQDGREALRQAKELLLSGGESNDIVKKLARAQVLLDDAGYTKLDDELGTAIKAARHNDETRVRTSIDAALTQLRNP